MKKNSLTGVGNVFSFTLVQTLKSKSYLISLIIMVALVFASMPVTNLITSGNKRISDEDNPIRKVYVNNESSLPDMDFTGLLNDKALAHISFEKMQGNYDTVADRIQTKEKDSVILTISDSDGVYNLFFSKAGDGPVDNGDLQQLGDAITGQFNALKIKSIGVAQEQLDKLNTPVMTSVSHADANGQSVVKKDTSISYAEYWFIYGILFVILMVCMLSSSLIASSIVTEKSTRVIEYLLITVKPLALMVGKILAMLVAVLIQTGAIVIAFIISNIVTAGFLSGSGESLLTQYLPDNIFANLNIINIIICFILMLLGTLLYGTLAGLAGATVSKMEEIQEGLKLFTLVSMIGAYLGVAAAIILMNNGENTFVTFTLLFPLSSPFILPGAFLIGKANILIVILSAIILIISVTLLFMLIAKIYESLILHNGNTIKPKEVLKMFLTAKEGK